MRRHGFHFQDALERRYDGPIPPADPAARRFLAGARARLFERLAGETVREAAALRRLLPAGKAVTDDRLGQLGRALARYRASGASWRSE